jgi:signal transduction histidine kinase
MGHAALLRRTDTKYLLSEAQFVQALAHLTGHYRVLEVGGRRAQHYQTLYFDTQDLALYRQHHDGWRNRYKVRERAYLDSDLAFGEVKHKVNADTTIKSRMQIGDLNPLTAISGFVEAMRDGMLKPTPARFEAMYVETQRLRRLVDDLRTLSLTDAGELHMDRQAVPPRMLLERLAAVYRHRAAESEIAITVQAEPNTPDIHVDQDRMAQVLGNLIDNALRYTPPGGEITLGARAQGAVTLLTVQDTGAGIPGEHLPHVFDRFYRGDSARSRDGAESGLGLAIAKAIVEAHGGTISVESTPGAGTTFTIALD